MKEYEEEGACDFAIFVFACLFGSVHVRVYNLDNFHDCIDNISKGIGGRGRTDDEEKKGGG